MTESTSVKVKYLDTSSIVKLYIEENASHIFRDFFNSEVSFSTTSMTFYESMNVLKTKLFKNGRKDIYHQAIEKLSIQGWGGKIEIETIDLTNRDIFLKVSKIAIDNNLDIADAIQIHAILEGKYARLTAESSSVLITADRKQENAAISNGIRVWNIERQAIPEWL